MNELLQYISTLDPIWIYFTIFLVALIENIFPPSPSDVIVVFGGALAAMEKGNFILALVAGTTGSTIGFMLMYIVGHWFGKKILDTGRISFINLDTLHKLERWFVKYGYWLIIGNRFLSGTRAVVSFFAGISGLNLVKTSVLSFVSSLCWYGILVYAGYSLGDHWEEVGTYLKSYGEVMTAIVIVILVSALIWYFFKKRRSDHQHE